MSDPLRTNPIRHNAPSTDGDAERDAKIESLLIAGLDHYFAADYAQAIDVWTRALFLDRNHARARAYIERARSAMAEQQRESEELLHNGVAAFERGEIEAARQMLNAAVQRGGAHEVALAFLTRIDRINAATPAAPAPVAAPSQLPFRPRTDALRAGSVRVGRAAVRSSSARRGCGGRCRLVGSAADDDACPETREPEDGSRPCASLQEPLIVPRSSETRSIARERCSRRDVSTTRCAPSISCGRPIRFAPRPTS